MSPDHFQPVGVEDPRRSAVAFFCFLLLIISLPWTIAPMAVTTGLCAVATLVLVPRSFWAQCLSTPVAIPALAWAAALVLSAWFGLDRTASMSRVTKGLFPALVPLAAVHTAHRKDAERTLTGLLLSSALASVFGALFYLAQGHGYPARARGAVGHYMTYGGQLLVLVSVALGVGLLGREPRWRWLGFGTAAAGLVALALTYTRSAWIGLAVALAVLIGGTRPRWLPVLALALAALVIVAPATYRDRLFSAFDLHHPTNLERTYMWTAGVRMFRDHPLTGVGLEDLKPVYDRYRLPEAKERAGHLHSVPVQIAATTGVVGLVAFALLLVALFRSTLIGLGPMLRAPDLAAGVRLGTLAALAGFCVAGLFEWNFGDEELLYLLYALVGVAWAARGWTAEARVDRA